MNKLKKIIFIGIILLGAILVLTGCTESENKMENKTEYNSTEITNIQECTHDWVVSSKYSWWTNSYKTVSKCSKCGRAID